MAFFCNGCRYRVRADVDWTAAEVKQALWKGGIQRANPRRNGNTPGLQKWEDLALIYAGQVMQNERPLADYNVPPGCQCMIAIEAALMEPGAKLDPDNEYWN